MGKRRFLLGDKETILYDPTGEISRVKPELNQSTSYQKLALPTASDQFHWTSGNTMLEETYTERGELEKFILYCGERKRTIASMKEGLSWL